MKYDCPGNPGNPHMWKTDCGYGQPFCVNCGVGMPLILPLTKEENATNEIVEDLCSRMGFDDFWDSIDPETQEEIKMAWAKIIAKHFA